MGYLFSRLVTFILAFFFILSGLLSLLIPLSEDIRHNVIFFIEEQGRLLLSIGVGLIAVGIAILIGLSMGRRRKYHVVKTAPQAVTVDSDLIQESLKVFWKRRFPKSDVPSKVVLKRDALQISADLPAVPLKDQKALIREIERDLQTFFAKTLGYSEPLHLFISFGDNS